MCGYRFPRVLCICVIVTPESQIIEFGIGLLALYLSTTYPYSLGGDSHYCRIDWLAYLCALRCWKSVQRLAAWSPCCSFEGHGYLDLGQVVCLHNLFLDSSRRTGALTSKIGLQIRLARPWRATPQHCFFEFCVIVLASLKELSIILVCCRCLVCWSRSNSLSVLHSKYQVRRQSHCC